jgi:hypothetical protein
MSYERNTSKMQSKTGLLKVRIYSDTKILEPLQLYCQNNMVGCVPCREAFPDIGKLCVGENLTPVLGENWMEDAPPAIRQLKSLGYFPHEDYSEVKVYSRILSSNKICDLLARMGSRLVKDRRKLFHAIDRYLKEREQMLEEEKDK